MRGVTGWLSGQRVGVEIQRSRVRIPSGAQEQTCEFFGVKTVVLTRCRCAQSPCVYACERPCTHVKDHSPCQSSVDYGNTKRQHALVPPKTEYGCSGCGGIKNGHIRYPSYGGTQKKNNCERFLLYRGLYLLNTSQCLQP